MTRAERYSKILVISPRFIFVQKAFLLGLFLVGGSLFSARLTVLEGILRFKKGQ